MSSPVVLKVDRLSKSFPGVRALHHVDLELHQGEVLAVIGENGAGKSTLMKILAGVQPADSGDLHLDGKSVRFANTRDAMDHGIVLIHQELNLCENLNVGENIFLGREPSRFGLLDRREIYRRSQEYLKRVGLEISPRTILGTLTIGRQQMVEIAKALSVQARILIFDEPTSSLSAKETESLFVLIDALREQGVSVIYISHRLGEVERLADRVTVLRDGENAGELLGDQINHDQMVRRMVGRELSQVFAHQTADLGEDVLTVDQLVTSAWPEHPVSFRVRKGEIVGVAGLVGAGRTEMLEALFGVSRPLSGTVSVDGQPVSIKSAKSAIKHGMALIPEDRKKQGLVIEMTIRNNIGLAGLSSFQHGLGLANLKRQRDDSSDMCQRLGIKCSTDQQIAKFLSGGNQQKVVIGKWLAMRPKVLLMDEPTRGIDVGAKQEIYQLMEQLARDGVGILVVSSELDEVMGISDRILVMHEGQLAGELSRDQFSEEAIMDLATGNQAVAKTGAKI